MPDAMTHSTIRPGRMLKCGSNDNNKFTALKDSVESDPPAQDTLGPRQATLLPKRHITLSKKQYAII
ncbi:hypothetical protein QJS10_CPA07g00446 [Acorus calamus]|uniref:Uncharacterized protein n=1 Tax=Acorus calamus TaxID=4465 RepID=A0AAV9EJW3_ACOCL|nr:hypothetical protein QJS10_CPA07g00446 [Acorus calamus]